MRFEGKVKSHPQMMKFDDRNDTTDSEHMTCVQKTLLETEPS